MTTSSVYKSLVQVAVPQPAPGPNAAGAAGSSIVVDLGALKKVFDPKEFEAVSDFANVLDEKEKASATKYFNRYKKKLTDSARSANGAAGRRWSQFWRLNNRGSNTALDLGNGAVLPQCYEEIKNLLVIQKSPIHARALEEWSKKEALFTSRVERKKKKVANLKNEIYQLIGFFSVFQGVLLTAVSQSSLLHCNNHWSPILLSVVASVVTIFGVVQKLLQVKSSQKAIHREVQSLKEVLARLSTLRAKGVEAFEFAKFENRESKKQLVRHFWIYFSLVIGSLLIFAAGFPVSHWRILCAPGSNPYQASVPSSS